MAGRGLWGQLRGMPVHGSAGLAWTPPSPRGSWHREGTFHPRARLPFKLSESRAPQPSYWAPSLPASELPVVWKQGCGEVFPVSAGVETAGPNHLSGLRQEHSGGPWSPSLQAQAQRCTRRACVPELCPPPTRGTCPVCSSSDTVAPPLPLPARHRGRSPPYEQ